MFRKLRRNQKGFSSLEAGMTLGLLTSTALIYETKGVTEQRTFDLQLESEAFRYHYHALYNHVKTMRDSLEVSTQTGPVTITVADLVSSGSVPASYSPTSNFGASFNGVVTREGSYQFAISAFSSGASGITDSDIGRIAQFAGYHGAGVYSSDTTNFSTQRGMLSEPLSDYTGATVEPAAGSYGLLGYFGVNENAPDYVSRSRSTGGANAMNVQFDMNNNDIINASEFRASGVPDGDGIDAGDTVTLNNLNASHAAGTAAVGATADTLVLRDSNGNFQSEDPVADLDVANRQWVLAQSGGGGPCGSDPTPGQDCGDGTTYVGKNSVNGDYLYVETVTTEWSGTFFQTTASNYTLGFSNLVQNCHNGSATTRQMAYCMDGEATTEAYARLEPDSAAGHCRSLSTGGYSDWYLPTVGELMTVFSVSNAIDFAPVVDGATIEYYWTANVWRQLFAYYIQWTSAGSFQVNYANHQFGPPGGDYSNYYAVCVRAHR